MNRGDVWWVNFDPALGGEIRKHRPAVILSNDFGTEARGFIAVGRDDGELFQNIPCKMSCRHFLSGDKVEHQRI